MTIQQMKYLLEVYSVGSISKAAASFFLPQSSLSNAIRSLEQELGFPIFIRNNKGVSPTKRGLLVLKEAGQIIDSYTRMCHLSDEISTAQVRICGAPYSPIYNAYEQLCIENQSKNQIDFAYITSYPEEAIEQLYLSLVDLAVVIINPHRLHGLTRLADSKGISIRPLSKIPIVIRIGPVHPLYREQNVSLNEFQQYTFVDYNNNYIWLSNEELLDVLPLNKNRIVIVPDRTSKNNLIYKSSMYSIGCKLPESLNQTYQFRNISLGELYCEIICLFNSKSKASQEAQRYMELLSLELEVL